MTDQLFSSSSGDGWLEGPAGEIRWGLYGASGVFLVEQTEGRLLLQKRALWTAQGGTWGIPGGAIDQHETPEIGALRELEEETGVPAAAITVRGSFKLDLGWWSYTTFIGTVTEPLELIADRESENLAWIPLEELEELPLHSAFASALPALRALYNTSR